MKAKLEARKQELLADITKWEDLQKTLLKQIAEIRIEIASMKGGVIEIDGMIKSIDDEGTDVSSELQIIEKATNALKGSEEE